MSQAVAKVDNHDAPTRVSLSTALSGYISYPECKRLLQQIELSRTKHGFKSLAVLSSFPKEGKSFLVLNLAVGYASLLGLRVLVVDVVSQPRNRMLFREVLTGNEFSVLGSSQGRVELLSTRNIEAHSTVTNDFQIVPYVNSLRDDFDLILFDTCAINAATTDNVDPVIIGKGADASILVTSPQSIGNANIAKLRENFEQWEIKLIGTVYNDGRES